MDKKTLTEAEMIEIIERAEALGNLPDFSQSRDSSELVAREKAREKSTVRASVSRSGISQSSGEKPT